MSHQTTRLLRRWPGYAGLISLLLGPFAGAEQPFGLEIELRNGPAGVAELSFTTSAGTLCRLCESPDLATWHIRQSVLASGTSARFAIPTGEAERGFFRVELITHQPLDQMVWIEPGRFVMGSPPDEEGRYLDKEEPQTCVTLSRGYRMSRYEVTQAEFEAVMGFNPSVFEGLSRRPVENVTWFEAQAYCALLTKQQCETGRLPKEFAYRLPTEAEWEYAARAGTTSRFSYGDDPGYTHLSDHAWYAGNSGLRPHPVGEKLPNPWGLHDLHGNVFEWCADWFGRLPGGWETDPGGPSDGTDRIIRGGYWDSTPAMCRSAVRVHFPPHTRISYLGFRVVLAEVRQP